MSEINNFFAFDASCKIEINNFKSSECFIVDVHTKFDSNDYPNHVKKWIANFSMATKTNWIVSRSFPDCKRLLFRKNYKCQHNCKNKSDKSAKNRQRNLKCKAFVNVLIKKVNKDTIKNDPFLKENLNVVIKVSIILIS